MKLVPLGSRATLDEGSRSACWADGGAMHPARFVRGLASAAEARGVRVFEGTAAESLSRDAVRTRMGTLRASAVVVCTNAYAPQLVRARIRPVRGQMLATAPLRERVLTRPAYAHRGYRYWRQTPEGRVLVGGWRDLAVDEEVGEEERTTERIQSALDGFLRESGIRVPVTHRWAAIMGFSHDGLPYVGRLADGVFVCGGFSGHGMGFALAAGELVAGLVRGRTPEGADLFDPERP